MFIKKLTNESINRYLKIILLFIILLAAISFFISLSSGSYLSHAGKRTYKPNVEAGHGFEGRVNALLAKLLLDTSVSSGYSINTLNSHYKSLRFIVPKVDGSELINKNSIRLIAVSPNTEEDRNFLYNSYLSDILKTQSKNLSNALFRIKLNEKTLRIESIIVEPNLYNLVLKSNNSQNNFAITNPYIELDNKVLFLINELNTVPLFSSTYANWQPLPDNPKLQINNNNIVSLNDLGENIGEFNPISNAFALYTKAKENKAMSFQIENTSSIIRVYNNNGKLELRLDNFDKVILADKSKTDSSCKQGELISIKRNQLPIKLLCYSPNNHYHEFKITDNLLSQKESKDVIKWNGNSTSSDFFTNQTITALNNIDEKFTTQANKVSCINPLLSKSLEDALKNKVAELKNIYRDDIIQISMALMDINTGELLAAPYYSSEFSDKFFNISEVKNYNFTKHFIGSTFKPLLSNASSIVYPKIGSFTLGTSAFSLNVVEKKCNLLGYPFNTIPFSKDGKLWTGCNNRVEYLAQSHDLYPIIQTMLALTEKGDTAYNSLRNIGFTTNLKNLNGSKSARYDVSNPTNTKIKEIERSSLANCISDLYGIPNQDIAYTDALMYHQLYDSILLGLNKKNIPNSILPEKVTLNANLLGNININDPYNNTEFTSLTSWILGQGANEWTNIHLAQAYARLFSKKNTTMTLWQNKQLAKRITTTHTYEPSSVNTSWSAFLEDFKTANTRGTLLTPAQTQFLTALTLSGSFIDKPLTLVGKTGTPNNYPRRTIYIDQGGNTQFYDEGLFAFGILSDYNTINTKGITGVVYIKRIAGTKPIGDGINSGVARDFLSADVLKNILFYTKSNY
jgi:hypothetical protein